MSRSGHAGIGRLCRSVISMERASTTCRQEGGAPNCTMTLSDAVWRSASRSVITGSDTHFCFGFFGRATHPVLNIVVDDEVQFFIGKAVMVREKAVDLIDLR